MTDQSELILGTAGHIDHGKTALVRALTGIDTDRLQQEKERGISIDIGFAHLDLGERRLGIVDVPGHERFIRNMLAGASGIDIAMLVVAADDSVMPQTREHLAILELLQVRQGIIAITKADLAEPSWLDLVETDVRELVEGTFLEDAPIVRTSAPTGAGLDELRTHLVELASRVEPARAGDHFRLNVDRSFVLKGLGTVVTGTVWSGSVNAGDEVDWLPSGKRLRVRGIQSHGHDVETVVRGQRAAMNLMGVKHSEIDRGHVLADAGYLSPSRRITARIRVLRESPFPLKHRARVRLHVGTQEVLADVWLLQGTLIEQGQWGLAQLSTIEPVVATGGQPFVVRAESPLCTIGGGNVLQAAARRISRRDETSIDRLAGLSSQDATTRADAATYFGGAGMTAGELSREIDVPPGEAESLLRQLDDAGVTEVLRGRARREVRLHRDRVAELRKQVLDAMHRLHAAASLEPRVPRERLLRRLRYLDEESVLAVLDKMLVDGDLVGDDTGLDTGVALPRFKPKLSEAERAIRERVIAACLSGGLKPPDTSELARSTHVSEDQLRPILEVCISAGELVRVDGTICLEAGHERDLRRRVVEGMSPDAGMTISQIRDLLGTTRKYAVPFCEYLDRVGVTKRHGDLRVLKGSDPFSG